jgi:hypothetical protein
MGKGDAGAVEKRSAVVSEQKARMDQGSMPGSNFRKSAAMFRNKKLTGCFF